MARIEYRENGIDGKAVYIYGYRNYDCPIKDILGLPCYITDRAEFFSFNKTEATKVFKALVSEGRCTAEPDMVSFNTGIEIEDGVKYRSLIVTMCSNDEDFLNANEEPLLERIGMMENIVDLFEKAEKAVIIQYLKRDLMELSRS